MNEIKDFDGLRLIVEFIERIRLYFLNSRIDS